MNWLLERLRDCGPSTARDLMWYCNAKRRYWCTAGLKRDLDKLIASQRVRIYQHKPKHGGRPTIIYEAIET